MGLSHLRIQAVRCLASVELRLHPERTYIFGPNGAGKTSILEAAYLLGRGRSFRTRQIRKLCQTGAQGLAVYGEVIEAGGRQRRLGVAWQAGRFEKRLDGNAADMTELAAVLPIHAIDPGLHSLIEGPPSERRRFLDWGVFHVEPRYLESWREYRRLVGQRNAALRSATSLELRAWTRALATAGSAVHAARVEYASQLGKAVGTHGHRLLGASLAVDYKPGWPAEQTLEEALAGSEAGDRLHGATQVGPHRADLRVRLEARGVRDEASRGQQKLVAIALVLGQVDVHFSQVQRRAVVLVDDPAAELDRVNLERLLATLEQLPAQLVLTSLSEAHMPRAAGFPVFHVERGKIQQL